MSPFSDYDYSFNALVRRPIKAYRFVRCVAATIFAANYLFRIDVLSGGEHTLQVSQRILKNAIYSLSTRMRCAAIMRDLMQPYTLHSSFELI